MAYEDQTLTCVSCGAEFVFSASEQAFFDEKGLTSPPKRCKPCRKRRRRNKRGRRGKRGEYRSPAFGDSAPEHQARGGRGHGRGRDPGRGRGEYRSPAFRDLENRGRDVYRSPAFRDRTYDDEYRAPGFRDTSADDAQSEYRAPGFRHSIADEAQSEYRAPGFRESRDNRPEHSRPAEKGTDDEDSGDEG